MSNKNIKKAIQIKNIFIYLSNNNYKKLRHEKINCIIRILYSRHVHTN